MHVIDVATAQNPKQSRFLTLQSPLIALPLLLTLAIFLVYLATYFAYAYNLFKFPFDYDQGEGFDPDRNKKLFERGYSSRKEKSGGLGLHWCANALTLMNGKLALESDGPGLGATAVITLRAAPPRSDDGFVPLPEDRVEQDPIRGSGAEFPVPRIQSLR